MTVSRFWADSRSHQWWRAGQIIGLVFVLLATGLPFEHSHPVHESSVYDGHCPDARLAMGAPGAPLPERPDGVVALVWCLTGIQLLPAEPSFRPLPLPTGRAPPA